MKATETDTSRTWNAGDPIYYLANTARTPEAWEIHVAVVAEDEHCSASTMKADASTFWARSYLEHAAYAFHSRAEAVQEIEQESKFQRETGYANPLTIHDSLSGGQKKAAYAKTVDGRLEALLLVRVSPDDLNTLKWHVAGQMLSALQDAYQMGVAVAAVRAKRRVEAKGSRAKASAK
jgi:hypothetical protein